MKHRKKIFFDENLTSFEKAYRTLPREKSKTSYASDLILELLKNEAENLVQHKYIVKALESVCDQKTEEPIFSIGNINGGFNLLNKNIYENNVFKERLDGGVFYCYTEDVFDLMASEVVQSTLEEESNTELVIQQIVRNLLSTFEMNNKLKKNILLSSEETTNQVIELVAKLSELEIFILKNNKSFHK